MILKSAIIFLTQVTVIALIGVMLTVMGMGFGTLMLWVDEHIQGDMNENDKTVD